MSNLDRVLATLRQRLGPGGVTEDPAIIAPRLREWRDRFHGRAPAWIRPASTDELAEVLAICHEAQVPVVPQGGNTGLCGGAIPDDSGRQLLLGLDRMNRVLEVDADGGSLTVEAGCVLARVQAAAREAGRLFALSLASEGSAQIGGCVSTNAGGTNVLRYGTAREQVLGLEVVLADGRVLDLLRSLRKDTAGYDLKQWFIGAEGTLGVISKVCARLHPLPGPLETAVVGLRDPATALALLGVLRDALGNALSAFELFPRQGLELVLDYRPAARDPLGRPQPWYVLLEAESPRVHAEDGVLSGVLAVAMERGLVADAALARSLGEARGFWALRDELSAAQKHAGPSIKHDIAVPLSAMGEFIEEATALAGRLIPGCRVLAFGHVGDGNVHFNVGCPPGLSPPVFLARWDEVAEAVHDLAIAHGGTPSAEHGIGQLKVGELARLRGGTELELMRGLKRMLDPRGILNPGKLFGA